jgi:hypothetical protein
VVAVADHAVMEVAAVETELQAVLEQLYYQYQQQIIPGL